MSTRSFGKREQKAPKTDPKWYPTTQGLNRWINRMAERSDLTVRVLKHTSGAPARFVPSEAEIDINEALISNIDPIIAGSPEFVVKHRAIAGACVHESAHAKHSTRLDLAKIARVHGQRVATTLAMLEEGRCETQQWPSLSDVEKLALQSMVLEIVLRDMENDEGETPELNMRGVIRLAGLLNARINVGIVDISQPLGKRMHDALLDALGADFAVLYDIAVRFSNVHIGWYDSSADSLVAITEEWIAVEDRLLPPDEDEGGESGSGEGEGEGEGTGTGKSKGKSKSKSKDKGDESDEADEEESDDGSGSGEEKSDEGDSDEGDDDGGGSDSGDGGEESESPVGDDDEGEVGDGSNTLDESDADGGASLGDYASSNVDAGTFEDIFNAVRDAAEEAERVSGSRLREQVVAIHRATAASHAERRRKNAVAKQRWR